MPRLTPRMTAFLSAIALFAAPGSHAIAAQDYAKYSPEALEKERAQLVDSRRGVMVPMRDGVSLSTDIYTPKNAKGPLPTILWKTPYNEHMLKGPGFRYMLESVKRGYVFIVQNERGRYFSQGKWEILGKPQTDGYDTLSWIAKQPWSNSKVGTLGCSSSAEWQLALAGLNHPAHAAMVPMSAGAGIGKVGRFQEQGNWYTGGVPRNLFFVWLYDVDNPLRAELPASLRDEKMRERIEAYNDLDPKKPKVDWNKQLKHLPVNQMLTAMGEPAGTFEQFIDRTPADPAWREGGLYHEGMGWGVPALWFDTWYDVSTGPNLELFNVARAANTDKEASANQYAVVAPVPHCAYARLGPDTKVGDRDMGDTSFDVDGAIYSWFDRWLKGDKKAFAATTPHVRYYMMGANRWQSAEQWPPKNAAPLRLYLRSGGQYTRWRRPPGNGRRTIGRNAGPLSLRPNESGADHRRRRLLQWRRGGARRVRPAPDRSARRCAGLQYRAIEESSRRGRFCRGGTEGVVKRKRHRLCGQAGRRCAGRHGLDFRRHHLPGPLPQRLRQAGDAGRR
jgi:putative CocE/NonD family hydrolase